MTDSVDLRPLLAGWPYDENKNLRVVQGEDGREVLQVRLPLGLEQLELLGRPDGTRPQGRESLLEYQIERLAKASEKGQADSFELGAEECAGLIQEGTLYYFRYLHCFQLGRFGDTVRDTERNLQLFDFVHRHAARAEDRLHLEKWRPYILRMNAAAKAMIELSRQDHPAAIEVVRKAIGQIEALEELEDETFDFERKRSLMALREFAAQIEQTRPVGELERLEKDLKKAIAAQAFERAAQLRDRIRALRASGPHQEN
jgi:hypothetical protein